MASPKVYNSISILQDKFFHYLIMPDKIYFLLYYKLVKPFADDDNGGTNVQVEDDLNFFCNGFSTVSSECFSDTESSSDARSII